MCPVGSVSLVSPNTTPMVCSMNGGPGGGFWGGMGLNFTLMVQYLMIIGL